MAKQWRPGSAGEAEQKQQKVINAFAIIVSVVGLLLQFVIPSQYRDAVRGTETWLQIIGGLLMAGSAVAIILSYWAGEEGSKPYSVAWVGMVAAGFLLAAIDKL